MQQYRPGNVGLNFQMDPDPFVASVNASSRQVRNIWTVFGSMLLYVFVTLTGVSAQDLLFNHNVLLPLVAIRLPITRFFVFAPLFVVMIHFFVLLRTRVLLDTLLRLNAYIREISSPGKPADLFRSMLDTYFLTEIVSGPQRNKVIRYSLKIIAYITLYVAPLAVLVYFQIIFLPYHSEAITWLHRLYVAVDLGAIVALRPRISAGHWRLAGTPIMAIAATAAIVTVESFSVLIATFPEEGAERLEKAVMPGAFSSFTIRDRSVFWPTGILGERAVSSIAIFSRNIVAVGYGRQTSTDHTEPDPLDFQQRNLSYATLDYAVLKNGDFDGADLTGASFEHADLSGSHFGCIEALSNDSAQNCAHGDAANFDEAALQDADFSGLGVRFDRASFAGAGLANASFASAVLRGAKFAAAELLGTDFSSSNLSDARFSYAAGQLADFSSSILVAAEFMSAQLQGANFTGSWPLATNFQQADLQAADFEQARAQLSTFSGASVQATDFSSAKLDGADFRHTKVWQTKMPPQENLKSADVQIELAPPDSRLQAWMQAAENALRPYHLDKRLHEALGALLVSEPAGGGDGLSNWMVAGTTDLDRSKLIAKFVCSQEKAAYANSILRAFFGLTYRYYSDYSYPIYDDLAPPIIPDSQPYLGQAYIYAPEHIVPLIPGAEMYSGVYHPDFGIYDVLSEVVRCGNNVPNSAKEYAAALLEDLKKRPQKPGN